MFKKTIRNIAKCFGQEVQSSFDFEAKKKYTQLLEKFILKTTGFSSKYNQSASIVIFSKDRAMQLDALLRSFYFYSNESPEIKVLYHCSNSSYESGYSKLINDSQYKKVAFLKESSFKADLITLFEQLNSSKVLFLVDDILFKNQFDFNEFSKFNPLSFTASLRHGKHLTYCYTLAKRQALPLFSKKAAFLTWDWNQADYDWAYPLSLDGHLFDTLEMKVLINDLAYKAPNSLEQAMQIMNPLFKQRPGLCYENSIIVNNPCNKVQVENDNLHGESQIEDLNTKWLKGYKIDFKKFEGILNTSAHQDLTFTFTKDD